MNETIRKLLDKRSKMKQYQKSIDEQNVLISNCRDEATTLLKSIFPDGRLRIDSYVNINLRDIINEWLCYVASMIKVRHTVKHNGYALNYLYGVKLHRCYSSYDPFRFGNVNDYTKGYPKFTDDGFFHKMQDTALNMLIPINNAALIHQDRVPKYIELSIKLCKLASIYVDLFSDKDVSKMKAIEQFTGYVYDYTLDSVEKIEELIPYYNECNQKIKTIESLKTELLLEFQAATTDYKVLNNLRHEKLRMI
jgi:hypothetical protein